MTIDDQIRDEKLHYDINREAAKIPALSLGKIMNILLIKIYYHLINSKFSYSPLGKAFEKQIKTIED